MQWNLLEVDEGLGSVPAIGVVDGGEASVGPASVEGREGERKSCEGGRPNSKGNWGMVVRKP